MTQVATAIFSSSGSCAAMRARASSAVRPSRGHHALTPGRRRARRRRSGRRGRCTRGSRRAARPRRTRRSRRHRPTRRSPAALAAAMRGCVMRPRSRARVFVGERDRAEPLAIELAVGGQDRGAEPRDELGERRLARLDDLARELVGIDHRRAALREHARDGALARRDAAGQPDHAAPSRLCVTTRCARAGRATPCGSCSSSLLLAPRRPRPGRAATGPAAPRAGSAIPQELAAWQATPHATHARPASPSAPPSELPRLPRHGRGAGGPGGRRRGRLRGVPRRGRGVRARRHHARSPGRARAGPRRPVDAEGAHGAVHAVSRADDARATVRSRRRRCIR